MRTAVLAAILAVPAAYATPDLLPADTVAAFGVTGLDSLEARFAPFADEFENSGLSAALQNMLAEEADADAVSGFLSDAGILDLIGSSAWAAVSVSSSNPLPTFTLMSQPDAEVRQQLSDRLAGLESEPGATSLMEGSQAFLSMPMDEDGFGSVNVALTGTNFVVSTNPDVLRGVLRREAGAAEPNLAGNSDFQAALAATGNGDVLTYVNLAAASSVLDRFARPFAQEFGAGGLLNEVVAAMNTLGIMASSSTFTDAGIESTSVQLIRDGGNERLQTLLLQRGPATRAALQFVGPDALGVASGSGNAAGWWDYLNAVVASNPELGLTSLDELFTAFLGVDIRAGFFSWVGEEFTTVTTTVPTVTQPGVASTNLLGEGLYILRTSDESGASTGLTGLLQTAATMAAMFTSLDGAAAPPAIVQNDVAGTTVSSLTFSDGITLSWAVTDGFVLVSTDDVSVAEALDVRASGQGISPVLNALLDNVPEGAVNYSVSDAGSMFGGLAETAASEFSMLAGLSGGDIDFDSLDETAAALTRFMEFVADRTGGSWSYTVVNGNEVRTTGLVEVDW